MDKGSVLVHQEQAVSFLTLERPRVRNRLSQEMAVSLTEACRRLDQDPAVRAVVVRGKGSAFSCGVQRPGSGAPLPRAAAALAKLGKPTIAAINGDATDQGLELALACDVRIAVAGARLGLTHLAKGLLPWDGGTQRLSRIVGQAWATDLLLTGRLVDAKEAERIGLVHQIAGPGQLMEAVRHVCAQILKGAPLAAAYAKEAVQKGLEVTLEQGLRLEADLNLLLHATHDRAEGIRSYLERRTPTFRGA